MVHFCAAPSNSKVGKDRITSCFLRFTADFAFARLHAFARCAEQTPVIVRRSSRKRLPTCPVYLLYRWLVSVGVECLRVAATEVLSRKRKQLALSV